MNDRPTAAPAIWPYPHRTLEQVRLDEERGLTKDEDSHVAAMKRGSDTLRETILTVQWCSKLGRKVG